MPNLKHGICLVLSDLLDGSMGVLMGELSAVLLA
jgi:hypothetical protein